MRKETSQKSNEKDVVSMPLVNLHAAGIDIGDKIHAVAVPEYITPVRVRTFGTMTCDLQEIVKWLKLCNIVTIAMESTGVYWKSLFSLLISEGFEVLLVNSSHVKNVTGRKNDEDDAMWLQKLHSCGLLKSSYLPEDEQDSLRTLVRYRKTLMQDASRFVLRMQKSLELMNIKLHTVISDIVGKTGAAIIEAIINGERNAANFLPLVGSRIKAEHAIIEKSLQGNWRQEHIFTLKESYALYKFYMERVSVCDEQINEQLSKYEALRNEGEITNHPNSEPTKKRERKKHNKHQPTFDVRTYLEKIHGVDVLAIHGISIMGGLDLLAETGTDLSKWENEKHFVSWLNLCPNNKISGGKLISSRVMKKKPNLASQAFRNSANSVQRSENWLGDYFRRMKSKGGNKYAVVATANKIATIYYKMIMYKKEFNPIDLQEYQMKRREHKIAYLERKLNQLKQTATELVV
jgi:transposase